MEWNEQKWNCWLKYDRNIISHLCIISSCSRAWLLFLCLILSHHFFLISVPRTFSWQIMGQSSSGTSAQRVFWIGTQREKQQFIVCLPLIIHSARFAAFIFCFWQIFLIVTYTFSSKAYAHAYVGTPYYVAPEIWDNKPYNNKRYDCVTMVIGLFSPFSLTQNNTKLNENDFGTFGNINIQVNNGILRCCYKSNPVLSSLWLSISIIW